MVKSLVAKFVLCARHADHWSHPTAGLGARSSAEFDLKISLIVCVLTPGVWKKRQQYLCVSDAKQCDEIMIGRQRNSKVSGQNRRPQVVLSRIALTMRLRIFPSFLQDSACRRRSKRDKTCWRFNYDLIVNLCAMLDNNNYWCSMVVHTPHATRLPRRFCELQYRLVRNIRRNTKKGYVIFLRSFLYGRISLINRFSHYFY